ASMLLPRRDIWHFLSASTLGALWVITRARPWPLGTLAVLDACSLILPGIGLALMAAQPDPEQLSDGLLALTVTMMSRAILVPSTATRTFVLSWIAAAPMLVVSILYHHLHVPSGSFELGFLKLVGSASSFLWLTLATTLSTVASRTIFGLRQQVKEATEIGQYTLEAKIGSGGMGEVWRAHHRMLIRPAALKLIRARGIGSGS